jgi:hypothetical protein
MIISKEFPPNYKKIEKAFHPGLNVVFTYGKIIYAPHIDFGLPDDLIFHEEVHSRRQADNPHFWWEKYIKDKEFRLQEEVVAYQRQYNFYLQHHDRNKTYFFLNLIACDLAGSNYGNMVNYQEAVRLIKG